MKKLLILWSLPDTQDQYNFYEWIISAGEKYFQEILSPIDTKEFVGSQEARFSRAVDNVSDADFIIANLSVASTWQGIELWIAYTQEKEFLAIAEMGSKISGLILWNPYCKSVIYYNSLEELHLKIEDYFKKLYT